MAKYFEFCFNAGYAGTSKKEIMKFNDDVTEKEVEECFEDWYASKRWDEGGYTEISEEEAEEFGVDEDYSDE